MAKILLQQLEALSAGDEQEQRFSVQMMSVELRCAYEDYTVAYRQLQDMLDRCGDTNYYSSGAVDRLRIMLKQAQLIIVSCHVFLLLYIKHVHYRMMATTGEMGCVVC
jgi:hypothetical protein